MTTTYKTYKWFNPRPSTITEGTAMYRDLVSKHHPTAPRMVLDFDWVLPATPANRHKILAEIIRRANKEA